jgi:bacterioferritin (cytochrome b1)
MSVTLSKVYEFVYRGHLAEEALDREGRQNCRLIKFADEEIARALSLGGHPKPAINGQLKTGHFE